MGEYTDICFSEIEGRNCSKCRVFTYKKCIGHDKCPHYKTFDQIELEEKKRFEYLRSLPEERQKHIEKKYGIDIWKGV